MLCAHEQGFFSGHKFYKRLIPAHLSCYAHGFREDLLTFFIKSLWKQIAPHGVATLDPRGMVGRVNIGGH